MNNRKDKKASKVVMALFNAQVQAKSVMKQFRATKHSLETRQRGWVVTSENVSRLNQFFKGKPTSASSTGMLTGVGIGIFIGLFLMIVLAFSFNLTITTPYVVVGLLSSAVFGAYLGALYLMRAQTGIVQEYKEELANGAALVLIPVREPTEAEIRRFLREQGGKEIQSVPFRAGNV